MDTEQVKLKKILRLLPRSFNLVCYGIEKLRGVIIDPSSAFVEAIVQFIQSFLNPTPKRNDKCVRLLAKDPHAYCLNGSKLSFFDTFSCVNGVPAYLLGGSNATLIPEDTKIAHDEGTTKDTMEHSEEEKHGSVHGTPFGGQSSATVGVCSFSSDSSKLAICYSCGDVTIWDTNTGMMLADTRIEDTTVSSVCFLGTSNSVLMICTHECQCWKWEIDNKDPSPLKIYDKESISIVAGKIFYQRSDFCADRTKLVFSTIVSCVQGPTLDVALVDMSANHDEHKPYHLSPVSIEDNYVISRTIVSPDGNGVLVGLMDQELEDSYCLMWPNYVEDRTIYKRFDKGTIGSWSSNNRYFVTWIMANRLNPDTDDENSVFIWNVQEMRENLTNHEYSFEPEKITNPFGDKVFWCQMTQDMDKKRQLIIGISGKFTRFVFWDMESNSHTHIIETKISAKDMMLCNKKAWIESCVKQNNVKGLSPIDLTTDRRMFGAALGIQSKVSMWDTHLGIEVLKVLPKDLHANKFNGGIDLMISPSSTKFAIVGNNSVMVFSPSDHNENKQRLKNCLETQMVQLDNHHIKQDNLSSSKMSFSGDGNSLGVLCVGLSKMQVWNLPQGTSCTIDVTHNTKGERIHNFCLSSNGQYLAIYISDYIHVVECKAEDVAQVISVINVDSPVASMGIKDDASELVLCMEDGSISWYKLSHEDIHPCGETRMSSSNSQRLGCDGLSIVERIKTWFTRSREDVEQELISERERCGPSLARETSIDIQYGTRCLTYSCHPLVGESNDASFQVSPIFKDVIRISEAQGVEAWDLETGMKLEDIVNDITSIKKSSHSYSRISSLTEQAREELTSKKNLLLQGTSIDLSKRTTLIQSSREDIFVAGNSSSQGFIQRSECSVGHSEYNEGWQEDSHSVYVVNFTDVKYRRRLSGRNLDPEKGLAISHDGRHVACLAGDFGSKVVVWNAYASEQLLPDYNFLSLTLDHDINHKEGIKRDILPLIDEFGINFFMFRHPSGMSILHESIYHLNNCLLKSILHYALKKEIKVSLLLSKESNVQTSTSSEHNVIQASIAGRSPKTLGVNLEYILKRVIHEEEVASILTSSLVKILEVYPTIFIRTIQDPRLLCRGCEIEIPESSLQGCKFIPCTINSLNTSKDEVEGLLNKDSIVEGQKDIFPTITSFVGTIPFKDACGIGANGLLRALLFNGVRHHVFSSFVIHAIVEFKWRKYARRLFIQELCHHCLVAVSFSVYCFILCDEGTYKMGQSNADNEEESKLTKISLYICVGIAIPCLIREFRQCIVYVWDHHLLGFVFWLKSGWNWIEVMSYLNLIIVVPLGQHCWLHKGKDTTWLSTLVAAESLLLWSRMLFYARPFTSTGPLVTTITSIVREIVSFLVLAMCVMFGFALAFRVLYRHVSCPEGEEGSNCFESLATPEVGKDQLESMDKAFGTFRRSLFTVFSYTFGDFQLDNQYNAPVPISSLILFILYVVILAIILLNMLIALMSDRFARIHKNRKTRLIEARARAIDDIDSMLSPDYKTDLE